MKDLSYEAALSPPYRCCLYCANIQPRNVLFNCFVYLERKKSATQRANLISSSSSLLPSLMGIQNLQGKNSWMLGTICLDFPKHTRSHPYYRMQIYTERVTLTPAECTSYSAGLLPQTSPKHKKEVNRWR